MGESQGESSQLNCRENASFKTDARMKRIDVAQLLSVFKNGRGKMTGRWMAN